MIVKEAIEWIIKSREKQEEEINRRKKGRGRREIRNESERKNR